MDLDSKSKGQSLMANLKDPKGALHRNRLNVIMYSVAFVLVLFVYHFLSDGDFSFLLTLGSLTRLFGFVLVLMRVVLEKSCTGISLKTLECYAVVFFCRLMSIMFYEGYLPYDSSGDWFFLFEFLSLATVCGIIYLVAVTFRSAYDPENDAFGKNMKIPAEFGVLFLIVPCLVLAMIIHPTLNQNFITDVSWTMALYLETVAVIPQLYMFQKSGSVEPWTSHFVFTQGLSRVFLFAFWLSSYHELNDKGGKSVTGGWVGAFVLLNQIIHLLVMGDFCFYYLKSAKQGSPLVLPGMQV